jgi:hypothetical protein
VAIAHAKSPSVGVYIEELMTLVTSDEPYSKLASWVAPGGLKLFNASFRLQNPVTRLFVRR